MAGKRLSLSLIIVMTTFCSCWRMPQEGEVSTIPATNNPSVIKQEMSPFVPGNGY